MLLNNLHHLCFKLDVFSSPQTKQPRQYCSQFLHRDIRIFVCDTRWSQCINSICSGVAWRRKVGGTNFFQKSAKQRKRSGVKVQYIIYVKYIIGCGMPTGTAYSSGHLVLSHFGTCMCSNVETNLSWTCLVSGLLNFEHPSVLLFCLILIRFRNYIYMLVDNLYIDICRYISLGN